MYVMIITNISPQFKIVPLYAYYKSLPIILISSKYFIIFNNNKEKLLKL